MLKCRHMRVRVRAPRAAVMRRREALALFLVLPLVVDPVQLLVEMQVLQGAKIKRIGRRRGRGTMTRGRRMSNLPLHQRTLGRNIQGRNPRGEGSLDRQLVC